MSGLDLVSSRAWQTASPPIAAALAATALLGCGNVVPTMNAGPDAASNPCAPKTCLLQDDFAGTSLNTSLWGMAVGGGGSVTQHDGVLTLHLPAAAGAFADVYSLVSFPVGTSFTASVTWNAGQTYDHKGIGFASARVAQDCFNGETESAMFRGQDNAAVVEAKSGGTSTCTLEVQPYAAGTNALEVTWTAGSVGFRQNSLALPAVTTNIPAGPLPIRFSAFTYATGVPNNPVQIDVDDIVVSPP
jgi:hypothetical protein